MVYLAIGLVGLLADTLMMLLCARLAGVEGADLRRALLAAAGAGLPLALASTSIVGMGMGGLGLVAVAMVVGIAAVRVAFNTTWGKALLVWFVHLCLWVLMTSLILQARQ